ncbi:MAG TPA: non-canonical purine NTP pyrophosphatase [Dongiaceae bacterium]|nr:non-canonical purine NTP pyrophosphatase [Dongiaceae bacterium]
MVTLLIATRNAHKVAEIRSILGARFQYLTLNDFPGAPKVAEDAATFSGNATKKAVELARWLGQQAVHPPSPRLRWAGSPPAYAALRRGRQSAFRGRPGKGWGEVLVLADDSGLEVDALAGAPGVHSARFAGLGRGEPENSSSAENNAKLLRLLKDVPFEKRTGRFRCVLAVSPVVGQEPEGASPVCQATEAELLTELFEGACEGRIVPAPRGEGGFGYDPLFVPDGYDLTFGELGQEVKNRLSHRARALEQLKQWFEREAPGEGAGPT